MQTIGGAGATAVAALPTRLLAYAHRMRGVTQTARGRTGDLTTRLERAAATRSEGLHIDAGLGHAVEAWLRGLEPLDQEVRRVGEAFAAADGRPVAVTTAAEDAARAQRIADLLAAEPYEPPSTLTLMFRTADQMLTNPWESIKIAAADPANAARGFAYGTAGAALVLGTGGLAAGAAGGGAAGAAGGSTLIAGGAASTFSWSATGAAAVSWGGTMAAGMSSVSSVAAEVLDDGPCRAERVTFTAGLAVLSGGIGGAFSAAARDGLALGTQAAATVSGEVIDAC